MRPRYLDAVKALTGNKINGGNLDGPLSKITLLDDAVVPTEDQIQVRLKELQVDYDAKQYQRDRKPEYPPIGDQLDMIYWDKKNDTKTWEESIDAVKAKYSKP